jgi:hypothetical protein
MTIGAAAAAFWFLGSVQASPTIVPSTVPARGRQEAILTLDHAAMVHLAVEGKAGTTCQIIDHLRGPFESSGRIGVENCSMDLLLDGGTYKLRLRSPKGKAKKGKGKAHITVQPFAELNAAPLRLPAGGAVEQTLHAGQQASYWIHLDKAQPVTLRVSGQNAGAVHLWRIGEWLEDDGLRDASFDLRNGQPIHEWWLETTLEAGDHLLTAYGTNPSVWTSGGGSDRISVAFGFVPGPSTHEAEVTLPSYGLAALELPDGGAAVVIDRRSTPGGDIEAGIYSLSDEGGTNLSSSQATCSIAAKALVPECSFTTSQKDRHVLLVHGAPGAQLSLRWSGYTEDSDLADGEYASTRNVISFVAPSTGSYLVATHDLPPDRDAPPLSCQLFQEIPHPSSSTTFESVASDFIHVSNTNAFGRSINYGGEAGATLWFEVTQPGLYKITTSGERKNSCTLFHFGGADRKQLEAGEAGKACALSKLLLPGRYELSLGGGTEGIEKLGVAPVLGSAPAASPTKTACLFPEVRLTRGERYRVIFSESGRATARGLFLRQLPAQLGVPLPVDLEPGATVSLKVSPGSSAEAHSEGGTSFACELSGRSVPSQGGVCRLPESFAGETLELSGGTEAATVDIGRLEPTRSPATPLAFTPSPQALEQLILAHPFFASFDRGEAHSLLLDIKEAGLYDVTTTGLLATRCAIRTPVFPQLAEDNSGGRGRNCLVATYLRPGRYLLTVATTGRSRGRAGILGRLRPVRLGPPVGADGQAFYRSEASELVVERLSIPKGKGGRFDLATTAQGSGSLGCRLEDADGWPIIRLPTRCSQRLQLASGGYLWAQLPLTVESMRHTRLERVQPPLVLKGKKPHAVALNDWYPVRLSKGGQDTFTFSLSAPVDVGIELTNAMQGRLYKLAADGSAEPVDVVPPQSVEPPPSSDGEGEAEAPPPEARSDGEGEGDSSEGNGEGAAQGNEGDEGESGGDATPAPTPQAAPAAPAIHTVHLAAGDYRLIAQHSQGDVDIRYKLRLSSDTLFPGVTKELQVPSHVALRVAQSGTVRLTTTGDTDVRCRLFDGAGKLLYESSNNGDDWNCALAEPMAAGDYDLVLESETQIPGPTQVTVSAPEVKEAGALVDGATLAVGSDVVASNLAVPPGESVVALTLHADTPFSCAIHDGSGKAVRRQTGTRECAALIHAPGESYRVEAWTLGRAARIHVSLSTRPATPLSGKTVPAGQAAIATIEQPGRYKTSEGMHCLPAAARGLLMPCGPEASLEQGPTLFAPLANVDAKLRLDPVRASLEDAVETHVELTRQPFIQEQRSSDRSVHLISLEAPHGQSTAPICSLEGGSRILTANGCFAASGETKSSLARWSAPSDLPVGAKLVRLAVPWPEAAPRLDSGLTSRDWKGQAARFPLPTLPAEEDLVLPAGAWAVELDPKGHAQDLCPPKEALSQCVLGSSGGDLLVYSPSEPHLEATVTLTGQPPAPVEVKGLWEDVSAKAGQLRLIVPVASAARTLRVDGADRCFISQDDGTRVHGCLAQLDANSAATVVVDRGPRLLRALVFAAGEEDRALLGPHASASSVTPLPPATALPVTGAALERGVTVSEPSVLHVRSTSGICALLQGDQPIQTNGWFQGCTLDRLVSPGTYRLFLRPFGSLPLDGTVTWTREPVANLADGLGPPTWVAPGQERLFRFQVASQGHVGLGLQVAADTLECSVLDAGQKAIGHGCQQFLSLEPGSYLLAVLAPTGSPPMRFRPVVVGLAGSKMEVPAEYLQDFFQRIRGQP